MGYTSRRGFTRIELVVLAVIVVVVLLVLLPLGRSRPHRGYRQLRDGTQIRGLHQSMVTYAGNNRDRYPLPSQLDPSGVTVDVGQAGDPARAGLLDSTRNIFSILVWQGFNPVEQMVSPVEAGNIETARGYEFEKPRHAANPGLAAWDPGFRATPEDVGYGAKEGDAGGFSYAHAIPLGSRAGRWGNTIVGTQAVLANRGPSYRLEGGAADGAWVLLDRVPGLAGRAADYDTPLGMDSNTLLMHGARGTWEGNVVYADNSSRMVSSPAMRDVVFRFSGLDAGRGRELPDNIFVNEDDAARVPAAGFVGNLQTFGPGSGMNAYLRSYAGGPGRMEMGGEEGARRWTVDVFLD